MHDGVFAPEAPLFPAGRAVYRGLDRAPRVARHVAHALEQAAKVSLFGCRDCGDCSLPEIAYVCPESQCAKNQRNGPCGGTREGLCEVYDTECIWSQAYERLKAYGEEESMLDGPVVVKDNALAGTSAWANTFLGRDHRRGRTRRDAATRQPLSRATCSGRRPRTRATQSEVGRYLDWLEAERGLAFADYHDLHRWSITDLEGFWGSLWDFFEVKAATPYERVLASDAMPGRACGSRARS